MTTINNSHSINIETDNGNYHLTANERMEFVAVTHGETGTVVEYDQARLAAMTPWDVADDIHEQIVEDLNYGEPEESQVSVAGTQWIKEEAQGFIDTCTAEQVESA